MSKLQVNNTSLYYEDTGGDAPETIVFSHGLLFSCRIFDEQISALKNDYRCVSYDHRGQAQSSVAEAGYDMDSLTDDAYELIQTLGIAPCHFMGVSMGGFVGMRLAIRHPQLLKSLTLLETTGDPEPSENKPRYNMLNFIARWFGLGMVAGQVMQIMFGQKFLNDPARAAQREQWKQRMIAHNRIGITRAVKGVIDRDGVYDQLDKITIPTLIMVGDQDVATVPEKSERLHARISNSKFVVIPGAGHTSTVEEPEAINKQLIAFLNTLSVGQ